MFVGVEVCFVCCCCGVVEVYIVGFWGDGWVVGVVVDVGGVYVGDELVVEMCVV